MAPCLSTQTDLSSQTLLEHPAPSRSPAKKIPKFDLGLALTLGDTAIGAGCCLRCVGSRLGVGKGGREKGREERQAGQRTGQFGF